MAAAAFEAQSVDDYIEIVAVTGELDMSSSAELRRRVEDAVRAGRNSIVIDLDRVTHMDSSGLAALIAAHQLTEERRGRLALVISSESVRRTVEVRGLDRLFTITPTREAGMTEVTDPAS
jgi:anti-anti-sigma factor